MNEQGEDRGFALLIALWSVVLLALLTTQLTATGHGELQLAANLRAAAAMEAQADGLVYGAIFRLMNDVPALRGVDGVSHAASVPGGKASVRVASLAGRINPNTAEEPLLAALLQQVGASQGAAARLAAAIADWRTPGQRPRPLGAKAAQYAAAGRDYAPPGTPFQTVEELGQVLGMTPELLARLAPHLSVFHPGSPVRADADPVVAGALQSLGADGEETADELLAEEGVYAEIEVQVIRGAGSTFSRRADVWAGHGSQQGRYLVLRWDVPAGG